MMNMTFYWGRRVTLLFDCWKTDSWTAYFFSLLACFLFSVFFQYMEYRRLQFKLVSDSKRPPRPQSPLLVQRLATSGKWAPSRFAEAILFGINSAIRYLSMLAVMSFNAGVFVAVVLGLGIGYLLFEVDDEDVVVVEDDDSCSCA